MGDLINNIDVTASAREAVDPKEIAALKPIDTPITGKALNEEIIALENLIPTIEANIKDLNTQIIEEMDRLNTVRASLDETKISLEKKYKELDALMKYGSL